jgi:hypothetical protein
MSENSLPQPQPDVEHVSPGRTSRNWRSDPVIMARLTVVAELLLRRANAYQISQATGSSFVTAKRDITRVRTLWRENALADIEHRRQEAVEQYRLIQQRAWDQYSKKENAGSARQPRYLQIVMDAQNHIDDLEGTKKAPMPISPTDRDPNYLDGLSDDELARIASGSRRFTGASGDDPA